MRILKAETLNIVPQRLPELCRAGLVIFDFTSSDVKKRELLLSFLPLIQLFMFELPIPAVADGTVGARFFSFLMQPGFLTGTRLGWTIKISRNKDFLQSYFSMPHRKEF